MDNENLKKMLSWFFDLAHLDQLLSVWELRSGPTPWLYMNQPESFTKAVGKKLSSTFAPELVKRYSLSGNIFRR